MRFTELLSACLIVLFLFAGSTTVGSLHEVIADRTRVMQYVPVNTVLSEPAQIARQWQGFHLQSFAPSHTPTGTVISSASPPAVWDEQLGMSFTQDFASLSYNVTAVEQADVDGYGPAYLLNGLSDSGYWYQVGLSWDWPNVGGGYASGFNLNYEVFNSIGSSIFPPSGGGGLDNFVGTVNAGDTILLSLNFSGGNVIMYGYDFNTGASAQESYSAVGASRFVGTPYSPDNSGFFTGLMTEWYHASEYFGDEASVLYSDPTVALSSAWMWMGEFDPDNGTSLFHATTPSPVYYSNSTQLHYLSSNGATEASNAYSFITGTANLVQIILSCSIVGGGTGYSPPALTYFFGDMQYDTTLSTSPTTYYVDSASVWNASNPLFGSSSTEIWTSNETTSGVASSPQTVNIVYYHQYLVNLGYTVSGAGVGYSTPNVTIEQFGNASLVVPPASVFIDAGSQCLYQNPLFGSNSTTRWENASTASITVSSSSNTSLTYFLQYSFTVSYSVSGGGNPTAPTITSTLFGKVDSFSVVISPLTYWLDEGASWALTNPLSGSSVGERWFTNQSSASGTVSSATALSPVFVHQFYVDLESDPVAGGSTNPASDWFNLGQQIQISAVPDSGWQFENWNGSGSDSYSGTVNQYNVTVNSSIVENAVFIPGLTISASSFGAVTYSYGSESGSVPAGSSRVLYVPLNANISLTAIPSLYLFRFIRWSGAVNSTVQQITVTATAPTILQANFDYNQSNVIITLEVVASALGVLVIMLFSRKRRATSSQKDQHEEVGKTVAS